MLLPKLSRTRRRRLFDRYQELVCTGGLNRIGRTFFGARIKCNLNDSIGTRIFFFGVWEPSVSLGIARILKTGDTFIDVGANIGYDSLLAADAVGPSGRVVAIEASPRIIPMLHENLRLNRFTNIRAVNEAVAEKPGLLQLYGGDEKNVGSTSPLPRPGLVPEELVQARPLDQILGADERRAARLIKIDIEGGELPVLRRFLDTAHLYHPNVNIIVEVSPQDGGHDLVEVFNRFMALGFSAYAVENVYSLFAYLPPKAVWPPARINSIPPRQTDLLLTRSTLAEL